MKRPIAGLHNFPTSSLGKSILHRFQHNNYSIIPQSVMPSKDCRVIRINFLRRFVRTGVHNQSAIGEETKEAIVLN